MAYGKKYNYYFYYDHDSTANYYEVAFLFDGYASTVTELTPGRNPFIQSIEGQKDSIEQPIMGSSVSMEVIATNADLSTFDADFLYSDYKECIVQLIQDPSGTPLTKWVGILLPENIDREYESRVNYTYVLAANDGFADLKNQYYTTSGKSYGVSYEGYGGLLDIIKNCNSKVADISELQLPYRIQLGTYSNEMTSTENAFKESEIIQDLFYDNSSGDNKVDKVSEVLEKILTPFYCTMVQWDGYYWIFCISENSSYYFEYDWATLTQQSRTVFNRQLAMRPLLSSGSLYKQPPVNILTTTLMNREYEAQLLSNGGFDTGVASWDNGDAAAGADPWDDLEGYDYLGIGGTMSLQWAGAATTGSYKFSTSSTFNLNYGANAGDVTVIIAIERFSETPSSLSAPTVTVRLYNATDNYISSILGATSISVVGGFQTITATFDAVNDITATANYLDVTVNVTDASTTSVQFYVDSVSLNQTSANDPADWAFRAGLTSDSSKVVKENKIYIAEKQESSSDICAIKDSGGNFVTGWTRYNKTEDIPLIEAFQEYYMRNNSYSANYLRVSFTDPSELTTPLNMLYDTTTSKFYRQVGFEKNYRDAAVDCQLQEVTPTDASVTFTKSRLSTVYEKEI